MTDSSSSGGFIRTVLGDRTEVGPGVVYAHEHLILDSPLIADRFPHIHLHDVDAAVTEVQACKAAGAVLMIDAMPMSSGRDAVRLAEIATRTGVDIVSATGLHHDRYYGPQHWTNHVSIDELTDLFVADLTVGIDEFDYTGPIVRHSDARAGILKVATSGAHPDQRDIRNLAAVASAHLRTGAPVLTHCEGGFGGLAQVEFLTDHGVPAPSIILSHVDKTHDLTYLRDLAETGVTLELDQALREYAKGLESITVRAALSLAESGFGDQIVVGTDGARRDLWTVYGGTPGLAWLALDLPELLSGAGIGPDDLDAILRTNAARALRWQPTSESGATDE